MSMITNGIVVTGGAGFIGSHIVDELMVQGHHVTVLDNFSEGKIENLARWVGSDRLEIVRGDIRDYELVRRTLDMKSGVFHLAACSRIQPSITDPAIAFTQNYIGTFNVLEAARQGHVKRVVYSASSSAYGRMSDYRCDPSSDYNRKRYAEGAKEAAQGLTEDLPTECLNPYSLSKKNGEELCQLYNDFYGLSTCSLRYFNVYGPRHQEDGAYATVIAIFRKQRRWNQEMTIVGTGEQRRDFTFVGDVVRANMLALFNREATGVFNIGAGRNYSINELAEKIGGPTVNIPPRLGEANLTLADCTKAKKVLGWTPNINLDQGLGLLDAYERKYNPGGIILL